MRDRHMARRTAVFLREFVVLFGFLNGVWLAVGVNPGRELLGVARGVVETFVRAQAVEVAFVLLPIALLVASLWLIHRRAGWLGFLAVGLAFVGGAVLLSSATLSFLLLVAGLGVGVVATA